MFVNKEIFTIHDAKQPCGRTSSSTPELDQQNHVLNFVKSTYPKQKYLILFFKILTKQNLTDENLFFNNFSSVHVADFCSFINNSFGKQDQTDLRFIKVCKYLQKLKLKFPKISVKNPVAQKFLC